MAVDTKPERWDTHHEGSIERARGRFYCSIWQTNQEPSIRQIRIFVEIFHNRIWEFKISYPTLGKEIINSVGDVNIWAIVRLKYCSLLHHSQGRPKHTQYILLCMTISASWGFKLTFLNDVEILKNKCSGMIPFSCSSLTNDRMIKK